MKRLKYQSIKNIYKANRKLNLKKILIIFSLHSLNQKDKIKMLIGNLLLLLKKNQMINYQLIIKFQKESYHVLQPDNFFIQVIIIYFHLGLWLKLRHFVYFSDKKILINIYTLNLIL